MFSKTVSSLGIGINLGDEVVSILLYADDLVLLAETETDLQILIDLLQVWCDEKKMRVNLDKTKLVHFRSPPTPKSKIPFQFGNVNIEIANQYTYLGVLLTEHLDYNALTAHVAKSANRALGLVISKYKAFSRLPFSTKLFNSIVWSTISYGAAIWGDRGFNCINAVQNRGERFFMGVGRYTPNAAVNGDIGWDKPIAKQWSSVVNNWIRIKNMHNGRITKKIYNWAALNKSPSCKMQLTEYQRNSKSLASIIDKIPMTLISFSRSHRHFETQIFIEKSLCAHYLLNQWLEYYQTSIDTSLGHGKEVIRFWWPWPHF